MERQKHGFEYQRRVIEKYNLFEDKNYTGVWDAFDLHGMPYIIKTFKKGTEIPLSDLFNNQSRDRDFYLVYGIWSKDTTNIIEEKVIEISIRKWSKLLEWQYYDELKNWIKYSVSNSYDYDYKWKTEVAQWKKKWGEDRIIQPRFKRDHKKQRRIQSAVSYKNLKTFVEYVEK